MTKDKPGTTHTLSKEIACRLFYITKSELENLALSLSCTCSVILIPLKMQINIIFKVISDSYFACLETVCGFKDKGFYGNYYFCEETSYNRM